MKKILIALGAIIVIALIAAAAMPKTFGYEDSITIEASSSNVWKHAGSLKGMDAWSPWMAKDENIKHTWEGEDGAVGSSNCWDSQVEEVGAGCQKVVEVEENKVFLTELNFTRPNEGLGKGYTYLEEDGEGTKVCWGFESEMPWPFNLMIPMMDMEKQMGEDWSNGLSKLKELSEASSAEEKRIAEEAAAAAEQEAAMEEQSSTEE